MQPTTRHSPGLPALSPLVFQVREVVPSVPTQKFGAKHFFQLPSNWWYCGWTKSISHHFQTMVETIAIACWRKNKEKHHSRVSEVVQDFVHPQYFKYLACFKTSLPKKKKTLVLTPPPCGVLDSRNRPAGFDHCPICQQCSISFPDRCSTLKPVTAFALNHCTISRTAFGELASTETHGVSMFGRAAPPKKKEWFFSWQRGKKGRIKNILPTQTPQEKSAPFNPWLGPLGRAAEAVVPIVRHHREQWRSLRAPAVHRGRRILAKSADPGAGGGGGGGPFLGSFPATWVWLNTGGGGGKDPLQRGIRMHYTPEHCNL